MPRKTMILKESTKRNKIKRLTKHLTKRSHKTAKFCQMNDQDAVEALAKLGYKIQFSMLDLEYKLVSC